MISKTKGKSSKYYDHVSKVTVADDIKIIEWSATMVPLKDFDANENNYYLKDYCKLNGLNYEDLRKHMRNFSK